MIYSVVLFWDSSNSTIPIRRFVTEVNFRLMEGDRNRLKVDKVILDKYNIKHHRSTSYLIDYDPSDKIDSYNGKLSKEVYESVRSYIRNKKLNTLI